MYCWKSKFAHFRLKIEFERAYFPIGRYLGYIRWPAISSNASSLDSNGTRIFTCVCHNIWTKLFKRQKVFRGNKRAKGRLSGTPLSQNYYRLCIGHNPTFEINISICECYRSETIFPPFGCQQFAIYYLKYPSVRVVWMWRLWSFQLESNGHCNYKIRTLLFVFLTISFK